MKPLEMRKVLLSFFFSRLLFRETQIASFFGFGISKFGMNLCVIASGRAVEQKRLG